MCCRSGTYGNQGRKYMGLIVRFYKEYAEQKESGKWGPTVVNK